MVAIGYVRHQAGWTGRSNDCWYCHLVGATICIQAHTAVQPNKRA